MFHKENLQNFFPLSWAQEELWLGLPKPGQRGNLTQPLELLHSQGLQPWPGAMLPFPWVSKPVRQYG